MHFGSFAILLRISGGNGGCNAAQLQNRARLPAVLQSCRD
jgi:hypothetical protein